MTRKQTSPADGKRYEVLHEMLRERQAEIRNKLRSLRQVLPAEVAEVKDAEEQSMEDFVRGMDFALMEMESETLRRIDEAMLRLQAGTYGACAECDGKIAEARLRALPFATLCRDCQEQTEEAHPHEPAARGLRRGAGGPGARPPPGEPAGREAQARAVGRARGAERLTRLILFPGAGEPGMQPRRLCSVPPARSWNAILPAVRVRHATSARRVSAPRLRRTSDGIDRDPRRTRREACPYRVEPDRPSQIPRSRASSRRPCSRPCRAASRWWCASARGTAKTTGPAISASSKRCPGAASRAGPRGAGGRRWCAHRRSWPAISRIRCAPGRGPSPSSRHAATRGDGAAPGRRAGEGV